MKKQIEKDSIETLQGDEILKLKQSIDHNGVFNSFEPEIKNMFRKYFESLLRYIYTFDS